MKFITSNLSFMKIALGGDHAGFEHKTELVKILKEQKHEVKDFGSFSMDSVDYPDYVHPVAEAIAEGEYDVGILVCGSANGVAITANKHAGIRAAVCWETEVAGLSRSHNDANVCCIPARFMNIETAKNIVNKFLTTSFEGGRHAKRVGKIECK